MPTVSYTRGIDLSGTFEGAGGIGGLLARTDHSTPQPSTAYYHADGNGNITTLIDINQVVVARYAYEPFGRVFSMSGSLAEANVYRFSSKETHPPSALVYYLYRYYDPTLQRWVNRDPIGEIDGPNLYSFVRSDMRSIDPFGLAVTIPKPGPTAFPYSTGGPLVFGPCYLMGVAEVASPSGRICMWLCFDIHYSAEIGKMVPAYSDPSPCGPCPLPSAPPGFPPPKGLPTPPEVNTVYE